MVYHFLPRHLRARYQELGRYGIGILLLLLFVLPGGFELLLVPVTFLLELSQAFVALWV